MRPYLAIFAMRFRLLLQYRAAAVAGLVTQLFFGAVLIAVMRAFHQQSGARTGLTLEQIVSYLWLSQAFFSLLPWRGDPEIMALVRSGGVAYELLRPIHLYAFWFARAMAMRTAPVILRAIPLLLAAWLALGLLPPVSVQATVLWIAALGGAVALSAAITVLFNLSLLWTISGEGTAQLLPAVVTLGSGLLLPLSLFPEWLQPVMRALPFGGLMDVPHRMYLGELVGGRALAALLQQWLWVLALTLLGVGLLHRGRRRVVVQGG